MTIKEFIEKAIEGGWREDEMNGDFIKVWEPDALNYRVEFKREDGMFDYFCISTRPEVTLLDPKAWKAVGKVEGWEDKFYAEAKADNSGAYTANSSQWKSEANWHMHQMIDHIIEGGTVESYIETL